MVIREPRLKVYVILPNFYSQCDTWSSVGNKVRKKSSRMFFCEPFLHSPEVFIKVMEQVENFEENSDMSLATTYAFPQFRTVSMVAEDIIPYGNKSEN